METTEGTLTPIIKALRFVTRRSTGEVFIHISEDFFEKDPTDTALALFEEMNMTKTQDRNAVLVYLNRRSRKFAIIADEGVHRKVGQRYWDELARNFSEDLQSTHYENALSLLTFSVGTTLSQKFPRES